MGRKLGTDPLESQHSKVLTQNSARSIRGGSNKTLHIGWLAPRLAWLGSTCNIFHETTCTSRQNPNPAAVHLTKSRVKAYEPTCSPLFKGRYDHAASVSDEKALTRLRVYRYAPPRCTAGALTALEVYITMGPQVPGRSDIH